MILKKLCIIYRRPKRPAFKRISARKFFYSSYKKILFLNFFLNFFCNKEMSMNFQTTLNNRTFRGTVNVNEALEALKGNTLPQIYKKDGTKYSPSYQKRLQNTREYITIIKLMKVIEERKRQI